MSWMRCGIELSQFLRIFLPSFYSILSVNTKVLGTSNHLKSYTMLGKRCRDGDLTWNIPRILPMFICPVYDPGDTRRFSVRRMKESMKDADAD